MKRRLIYSILTASLFAFACKKSSTPQPSPAPAVSTPVTMDFYESRGVDSLHANSFVITNESGTVVYGPTATAFVRIDSTAYAIQRIICTLTYGISGTTITVNSGHTYTVTLKTGSSTVRTGQFTVAADGTCTSGSNVISTTCPGKKSSIY
jgi:hypothetical protein